MPNSVPAAIGPPPSFRFGTEAVLGDGDRFISLLHQHQRGHVADYRRKRVTTWQSAVHPPWYLADGSPIPSQTDAYCSVFHLSGMAAAADALVVEMGTLIGHSSRCLAAGLSARSQRERNTTLYVAFDFFTLWDSVAPKPFSLLHPWASRESTLTAAHERLQGRPYHDAIWRDLMVRPVYGGPLQAVPGDIEREALAYFARVPPTAPVNVWSIDSAKTKASFVRQAAAVWPRLVNGSIIHLVDNAKQQLFFFFTQFVMNNLVEVAYLSFTSSPWSFVVRRAPLPWDKVTGYKGSAHYTAREWAEIDEQLNLLIRRFAREYQAPPGDLEHILALVEKMRRKSRN
jgi:hypothetical protein